MSRLDCVAAPAGASTCCSNRAAERFWRSLLSRIHAAVCPLLHAGSTTAHPPTPSATCRRAGAAGCVCGAPAAAAAQGVGQAHPAGCRQRLAVCGSSRERRPAAVGAAGGQPAAADGCGRGRAAGAGGALWGDGGQGRQQGKQLLPEIWLDTIAAGCCCCADAALRPLPCCCIPLDASQPRKAAHAHAHACPPPMLPCRAVTGSTG